MIDFFNIMKVYANVNREEVKWFGAKVITIRWLDVNTGDNGNPGYRARLVGREIKKGSRYELSVVISPIEVFRVMSSICAFNQHGTMFYHMSSPDIQRVYFFAKAKRHISIDIFSDDFEHGVENKVGRFNFCFDGTRDVAFNWQGESTELLYQWMHQWEIFSTQFSPQTEGIVYDCPRL